VHIVPIEMSYYSMHVMYCGLRVGFLYDGDMLHGGTLSYVIIAIEVFMCID
jgi:hypothetical protein